MSYEEASKHFYEWCIGGVYFWFPIGGEINDTFSNFERPMIVSFQFEF